MNEEQDTLPAPAFPVEAAEIAPLAQKMARAYRDMVAYYHQQLEKEFAEAKALAEDFGSEEYRERLLAGPPDQVSWYGLSLLADEDPQLARRRYGEVKEAALDQLRTGQRMAEAALYDAEPWDTAQLLALRRELARGWDPASGIEQTLIDQMAQSYTMQLQWQAILTVRTSLQTRRRDEREARWEPPRVRDAEAVQQAAEMVDRWNRMFLRQLRALRDMRRYSPVVVQNAGQVNLAGQQVNVAAVPVDGQGSRA